MPSWRPEHASDPDDENEWRFTPLSERDPELAAALIERYGVRWLRLANLSENRLSEVPDTVELLVASDWTEPPGAGLRILRLRSWYTGSTYWFPGWDGSRADAERWIDDMADLQARNVVDERKYGPTEWDDPTEWTAPVKPPRPPGFHGIVEDGDPGGPSIHVVSRFEFSSEPRTEDVALAVERLTQSPEIPTELAAEARAHAAEASSPRGFFEWLATKLRDREPDPEPIDCGCGAALLDPTEFSGGAIVRCGLCGARWGIQVEDSDSWSRWSVDVPSAKNTADSDGSPAADIEAEEATKALLDGLRQPNPPPSIEPDGEVVVCVWHEGDLGAVMTISHDPEDAEEPYSVEVETFQRDRDTWIWCGAGGSDWPATYASRPPLGRPALTGFSTGLPGDDPRWLWTGIAPARVDSVRVALVDGTTIEVGVEPVTGAFIVALPYPPPDPAAFEGIEE